ncbi:hypothetical protein [Trichlorobacter lovleyi]|uniref:hypothetical protein n=1 Tax=Trichlorobacter lovleyi TaxID=313985 RepID=UPI002480F2B2|nr:hypothetical protein [Trichlorobacter lovleyi]
MDNPGKARTGISYTDQLLLEKCRSIELLSRDLYYCFADTYADSPEADYLWRKTAREEQNHADQFSLALKLHKGLRLSTGISLEKADRLIEQLTTGIEKVTNTPLPLIEALAFAVKLEHFLTELHLSCMAEFTDKSFSDLFKAMMSSDQDHVASIEALYTKLTTATRTDSLITTKEQVQPAPPTRNTQSTLEPYQNKILELFKEQEMLMASIYQKLAQLYPEHADSYLKLVAEEMEHAGWIEQLQTACQAGIACFGEGKTRSYTISGMISYMQDFYKRLETGQLTELQALTAVVDFEQSLIERNIFQRFCGDSPNVIKTLLMLEKTQKIHSGHISILFQQVRSPAV